MSGYTEVFGGNTVYPSDVSYLALSLTADTQMYWALDANTGVPVLARIVDITPSGAYSITMPDATLTGAGQTILFNNLGPSAVTIKDFAGGTLASLSAGEQWQLYLTSSSTSAGTWQVFRYGAATAQAQASSLAGFGLTATGATLSQSTPTTTLSSTYTVGASDRAKLFVWTGGLGTLNLPSVSAMLNGFSVSFNNQGSGDWTITRNGSDLIDGAATLVLAPGESVTLATNALAWYSLGLGPAVASNFDYTLINLTGQTSPYTLSGAELNRVAYDFAGTLTANMVVVVPSTIQEYWVTNSTTGGSYTLSFRTASQSPAVVVARGSRDIYYCTGSMFVLASTGGVAVPIAVVDGGTGSTTAGGALTNLGGTAVGTALFTASTAAVGRTTLGSTTVGDAVFIASTAGTARTALGATAVGDAVFIASTAGAARTTLGSTTIGDAVFIASNAAAAQTALSLTPGTNVQAYNVNLQAFSGVTSAASKLFYFTGSGTGAVTDLTGVARTLIAQTSQTTMRTTGLGCGDLAGLNTINNAHWSGTALAVGNGGTGSTTAAAALTALGGMSNTRTRVSAYRSATLTVVNNSVDTKFVFDAETFDDRNEFNTSTGTFTAAATGTYLVTVSLSTLSVGSGTNIISIRKNGSQAKQNFKYTSTASVYDTLPLTGVVKLTAGDTLEVYYQNSTSANFVVQNTAVATFLDIVEV